MLSLSGKNWARTMWCVNMMKKYCSMPYNQIEINKFEKSNWIAPYRNISGKKYGEGVNIQPVIFVPLAISLKNDGK